MVKNANNNKIGCPRVGKWKGREEIDVVIVIAVVANFRMLININCFPKNCQKNEPHSRR